MHKLCIRIHRLYIHHSKLRDATKYMITAVFVIIAAACEITAACMIVAATCVIVAAAHVSIAACMDVAG